ncbi:LysR family transcriptional regulator [Verrucosispora sp. WMMD703]|uniref:LysR family transcriptional regulator n=1 Tax=unclassified Micromonospora TaxID=2617518 RepID=UPI00249A1B03|nr:LysR family transcriptional regulator [Verrucosispora sp. WMMD1129]WFE45540.1 LysR family transcriptional regulator [Verrucosispora sp. WMMD1129]
MDVDLRLLRYFSAVAEEGNLTRAARRLFVSQPALSKQIQRLEALLDVELFVRSRDGMQLTDPGRVLAARMPALLANWDDALSEVRAAASRSARVLRIGFLASAANEATPRIVETFRREQPGWEVVMRQAAWSNPTAGLLTGDTDVGLLRLPCPDQHRLRVAMLFTEPRWVALPTTHPLAGRNEIRCGELWDEPFVAAAPESGRWRDFWLGVDERVGRPVRIGAVVDQPDDWLNAIANGYGIAFAPASSARFYARPGVVYRPVTGLSPSQVAVAWPSAAHNDAVVQAFVRCCLAITRQPTGPDADVRVPAGGCHA